MVAANSQSLPSNATKLSLNILQNSQSTSDCNMVANSEVQSFSTHLTNPGAIKSPLNIPQNSLPTSDNNMFANSEVQKFPQNLANSLPTNVTPSPKKNSPLIIPINSVSTPRRSLVGGTNCNQTNFAEITIKTDEYINTGCDTRNSINQEYNNGANFHSPPYMDHTYASPPHKQRREDRSSQSPLKMSSSSPSCRISTAATLIDNKSDTKANTADESKPTNFDFCPGNQNMTSLLKIDNDNMKLTEATPNSDCIKEEVKEEVVTDGEQKMVKPESHQDVEVKQETEPKEDEMLINGDSEVVEKKLEVKDEAKEKPNEVKEENDTKAEESAPPRSRRYGLRENRGLKYNVFKEDLLFKEQLLQAVKEESKKEKKVQNGVTKCPRVSTKVNGVRKNGIVEVELKSGKKVKELEYRTLEWARDALYFSYEPNFLFLDDENGFVCDCCDPKTRRRGGGSSEDNSEAELNDIQEDDGSATEEGESSYQEETPVVKVQHAPGWFGKGRRKRGKTK
eukprot:TRINITY_DN33739_c0_g2_i2.p1 TRINITY_DN33739_c0_g2~~TRINITY_DN33739_c0_g2_i2.p1  ORF type:complete len:517 (+),score=136.37 TRINITY_DN33739_c0_g2_i2:27-1553(+)